MWRVEGCRRAISREILIENRKASSIAGEFKGLKIVIKRRGADEVNGL